MRPHVFLFSAIVILVIALIVSAITRTDSFVVGAGGRVVGGQPSVTGSSPDILTTGMGMSGATRSSDLGDSERRSYCQKCCDSGPETCDPNYKCGDC
jgi:hypothetical protein